MKLPIARRSALDARVRELEEARNERNALARQAAAHAEARALAETSLAALEGDRNRLNAALLRARAELGRDATVVARREVDPAAAVARLEAAQVDADARSAMTQAETEARLETAEAEASARFATLEQTYGALTITHLHATQRLEALDSEVARLGAETMRLEAEKRDFVIALDNARQERIGLQAALDRATRRSRPIRHQDEATERAYFIVFSLGRTATQWLVEALNAHDDILATHAMDIGPRKRPSSSLGEAFLKSLKRQRQVAAAVSGVDSAFDLMESAPQKAIGNVHGLDGLPVFENPDSYARSYHVSYMIRHPVLRLRSLVDRWKYEINLDKALRVEMRDAFDAMRSHHDQANLFDSIDGHDDDDWLFAHAVVYLLTGERRYLESAVPHIICERLVSDRDYFAWYLREITGDRVELNSDYLDRVMRMAPVDPRDNSSSSACAMFQDWPKWRRDLFAATLERESTQGLYSELGYDTRFATRRRKGIVLQ